MVFHCVTSLSLEMLLNGSTVRMNLVKEIHSEEESDTALSLFKGEFMGSGPNSETDRAHEISLMGLKVGLIQRPSAQLA